MPRYLIEVPHDENVVACARAVESFLQLGSHFVAHADWGCMDGVHKAWITIEAESREEARDILPPAYRANATIIRLNTFTMDEIEEILRRHGKK